MHFSTILARADEGTLQALIGRPALRLLKALDPALASPSSLRELLNGLRSADSLLSDPTARGMLLDLLRPAEAQQLAVLLALDVPSDSYAALRATNIRRGSARERSLFGFFELLPPQPEGAEGPVARQLAPATVALFSHQREAARRVRQALTIAPQRVLLHMPTGAGKTRTAMHVIADHLRSREPALVVWLASSEELCEQSAGAFSETWRSLGDREVTVQRFWGDRELDLTQCRDGILVAGLAKLYRAALESLPLIGTLAGRCSLVVIDEAHQAIAETYSLLLNTLVSQGSAALLGLTATPGRTWDDIGADAELAAFFGKRKVTLRVPGYSTPFPSVGSQGTRFAGAIPTGQTTVPPIPLPKRLGLRLLRTLLAPDCDSLVCRVPARRSVGYNRTRLALHHPLQSQRVLARVHGVGSLHGHHFTCHPCFVAEPPMIVQVPHHSDAVMPPLQHDCMDVATSAHAVKHHKT